MILQKHTITQVLVAIALLFGNAFAQTNWIPDLYEGVPDNEKSVVFIDEFEDNRNQWDMGSVYLNERIENGEFFCASYSNNTYTKHKAIDMALASDFEAEVRIRFVKGMSGDHAGLTFGRDVRGNGYHIAFNSNLQYKVSRTENGRTYDIKGWQGDPALRHKHAYNNLMVRQVEGRWYIFINRRLVTEMTAQPLFGSAMGFSMGGHMAVEVDYLRVAQLRSVDNEGPLLSMVIPEAANGQIITLEERTQTLEGQVSDISGIKTLTINGQDISLSADGVFKASLSLPSDPIGIHVVARDRFNNESRLDFTLKYEEPERIRMTTVTEMQDNYGSNWYSSTMENPYEGENYLLLIGVNQYNNWNPLHNAVKDCQDLASTLMNFYWFDQDHIITLYNEKATREGILETLEALQEMVGPDDNLIIYYAGHGYYDDFSELGYWVPVDARLNKIPDFIPNSTIHDYLRTIETHNTLLIADACYAGSLFASYRGTIVEGARSRWAFTSGDIEKVWDGRPGQNSPFAHYLIEYLRNNRREVLPANVLIEEVGIQVQNNTAQTPQGNPLRGAGDKGGIFVFHRRR